MSIIEKQFAGIQLKFRRKNNWSADESYQTFANVIFKTTIESTKSGYRNCKKVIYANPKLAVLEQTATYLYEGTVWMHLLNRFDGHANVGLDFNEEFYVSIPNSDSEILFILTIRRKTTQS